MDYKKTAELIQSARKEKNLTQRELAEILGVTDRAVSKWERAKSFPDVAMLQPLADELGLSVTELLDGRRRTEDAALTVGEAEKAAIRGIDGYVSDTRKKSKPLWVALALLVVMLAAVGLYEYNKYSQSPTNFQEDELVFADMVYREDKTKVHRFSLEDVFGQELRNQLTEFLRTVPQGKEVRKVPVARTILPSVDFEGLAAFYEDCYYDYKNGKYYEFPWSDNLYRRLAGICEDMISYESYEYTGPTYLENGGKYMKINCPVTEQPMELMVQRYAQMVELYDPEAYPGFYRNYIIDSIKRLTPEEYENTWKYAEWLSKEIAYRGIYSYRVYRMQVTFEDSDLYKGSGPQYPEGTYEFIFMAAKSEGNGGHFEVLDEYVGNYWNVQ